MCGIIGYCGPLDAQTVLLNGLTQLEYRGYDSAGIALFDENSKIHFIKKVGKVAALRKVCEEDPIVSHCGIGHTRWATHGGVTSENAHPHVAGKVTMIHNGIIENYHALTAKYHLEGKLHSQTDTEVAAATLNEIYNGDPFSSIHEFLRQLEGSYAFCIMFEDRPGEIYAVRNVSPLVAAYTASGAMIASDLTALLPYSKKYFVVPEGKLVQLTAYHASLYELDGTKVEPEILEASWNTDAAMKNGFPHFMMKEIHEQPKAIRDTINSVVRDGKIDLSGVGITEEEIQKLQQIYIVACGSAYHVGVAAQYVIEELAQIPVRVELASEFRYRRMLFAPNSLVIIVSQSGETADSLAALREAKAHGVKTLAIVNVVGSTIAREADHVFYTLAGPEIAVATTKAYSTQLIASYILSIEFARVRGKIDEDRAAELIAELQTIPDKIEKLLEDKERIQWFAAKQMNAQNMFFIGRGIDYAVSLEGSLKMKEISYIHSEAYAAGELKHGTISLIEPGTLVIGVLTQQDLYEKTVSNMVECKSRGAYLMALTTYGNYSIEDCAEFVIYIPKTDPLFAASLAVIPLQLLGYYVSVAKGLDVDKPRNLAKSVTVE